MCQSHPCDRRATVCPRDIANCSYLPVSTLAIVASLLALKQITRASRLLIQLPARYLHSPSLTSFRASSKCHVSSQAFSDHSTKNIPPAELPVPFCFIFLHGAYHYLTWVYFTSSVCVLFMSSTQGSKLNRDQDSHLCYLPLCTKLYRVHNRHRIKLK